MTEAIGPLTDIDGTLIVEENPERWEKFWADKDAGKVALEESPKPKHKAPEPIAMTPEAVVVPSPRETILEEAARITQGPRQRDYDHPRPNHQRIASLWNAYIKCRKHPGSDLDAEDVGRMMILLKIARDIFTPTRDNLVDFCGYARCLERMRAMGGDENYAP